MALGIAVNSGNDQQVRQVGQTLPLPTDRLFQIGRRAGLDVTILSHNLNRYQCQIAVRDGDVWIQQIGPWGYELSSGIHAVMHINGRTFLETGYFGYFDACIKWTTSTTIETRFQAIAAFRVVSGPTARFGCSDPSLWKQLFVGDEIQFCDDIALLRLVHMDS